MCPGRGGHLSHSTEEKPTEEVPAEFEENVV